MKKIEIKTSIVLALYISKIEGRFYAGIDGNTNDLENIGISYDKFSELANDIEKVVQKIFNEETNGN